MKKIITYFILLGAALVLTAEDGMAQAALEANQYVLSVTGDTMNRTNDKGVRYGIWNVYHESRYGDDAFFEVGKFENNRRHGLWKTYSQEGYIMNSTNYYNGYRNGEVKFYDRGRLVCKGNYKALRTDVAYDTLMIENPVDNSFKEKIVPTSLGWVRHGFWTYYKPPFNKIYKVEEYQVDELVYSHDYENEQDSVAIQKRVNMFPHNSNKLPPGIWTSERGKRAPRFTDFPTNTKSVKPNPGKKKLKN